MKKPKKDEVWTEHPSHFAFTEGSPTTEPADKVGTSITYEQVAATPLVPAPSSPPYTITTTGTPKAWEPPPAWEQNILSAMGVPPSVLYPGAGAQQALLGMQIEQAKQMAEIAAQELYMEGISPVEDLQGKVEKDMQQMMDEEVIKQLIKISAGANTPKKRIGRLKKIAQRMKDEETEKED